MEKKNSEDFQGTTSDAFKKKGSLLEPIFLRSEIDVNPSNFHYWKLNKLLLTIPDGKWAELSIVDIIWLEILKSMKSLGCSLKSMKAVHKLLFEDSYHNNHAEQVLKKNLAFFMDQEKFRRLTEDELVLKNSLVDTMSDHLLNRYFRWSVSYLYTLVLEFIENCSPIHIRLFENGQVIITGHKPECGVPTDGSMEQHNTFIQISISDIINQFFSSPVIERKMGEVGYLSKEELLILTEIRRKNIRKLTIHFENDEHRVKKIETDSVGLLDKDKAREVMNILGLKNYTGIELNTRDGQSLSFVRTEKRFFK